MSLSAAATSPPPGIGAGSSRSWGDVVWAMTLLGVWFWALRALAFWWGLSPVYEYGFVVPWIAIFLAWQRLRRSPDCLVAAPVRTGFGWLRILLMAVAWGALGLGELLRRIDPVWRPVSFLMLLGATLLTVVWTWRRGGARLLKVLAFPIAFIWTALPWPGFLDDPVTMTLRAAVTEGVQKALGLVGIHAVRNVNVLELAQGPVGVEDACSGIVSLHSSLMVSLFLGEFLCLTLGRRFLLVVGACCIAVCSNLIRTFTLCLLVTREGLDAVTKYHDRLGLLATVLIFGGIVALGWVLTLRLARPPQKLAPPEVGLQLFTRGNANLVTAGVTSVAFLSIPLLASLWFGLRSDGGEKVQEAPLWTLRPEKAPYGWQGKTVEIPGFQKDSLGFSEGESASIQRASSGSVQIYHFFWRGERSGIPYGHTPDICMSYVGWKQTGSVKPITLQIGEQAFPAQLFSFVKDGESVLALHTFWRGGEPGLTGNDLLDNRRFARLPLLLSGPRLFGMEELLVFIAAPGDERTQIATAERVLSRVLIPSGVGAVGSSAAPVPASEGDQSAAK